eukprot:1145347-Pelagomonas_calceolata.AAC.3
MALLEDTGDAHARRKASLLVCGERKGGCCWGGPCMCESGAPVEVEAEGPLVRRAKGGGGPGGRGARGGAAAAAADMCAGLLYPLLPPAAVGGAATSNGDGYVSALLLQGCSSGGEGGWAWPWGCATVCCDVRILLWWATGAWCSPSKAGAPRIDPLFTAAPIVGGQLSSSSLARQRRGGRDVLGGADIGGGDEWPAEWEQGGACSH